MPEHFKQQYSDQSKWYSDNRKKPLQGPRLKPPYQGRGQQQVSGAGQHGIESAPKSKRLRRSA